MSGGLRGLTHRAVDREAGLSEGSTSAYFRTRDALQLALAGHVIDSAAADLDALVDDLESCDLEDRRALDLVTSMFADWLTSADLIVAQVELALEAGRNPALRDLYGAARERVIDVLEPVLTAHEIEPPRAWAEAFLAAADGVIIGAVMRPPEERAAYLDTAMPLVFGRLQAS